MLKRDSIWFGLLLGTVLPFALWLILMVIGRYIPQDTLIARPFSGNKPILFSLIINLLTLRIYFVNLKFDRTGKGILLATFTLMLVFFIFFKHL